MNQSVCVVITTFHPRQEDIVNLVSIRNEAQFMVVVDNGSEETSLIDLRKRCQQLNIHLIENGANMGMAVALNTGIRWALSQNCKWVILFDQDSKPLPSFVEKLLFALVNHPQTQKIAIMLPSYLDIRSNAPMKPLRASSGEILVAMASGSLMPTAVFEKEGWFDEKFLTDYVDYDYSLKVRDHGWIIEECKNAILMHQLASPTIHKWFGYRTFITQNYSPFRRYCQTRNVLWMLRRYKKTHLSFCIYRNYRNLIELIKIIAEDNRREKWQAAFRGYMDGIVTSPNSER